MVDAHPLKAYREKQNPKLSQAALAEKLGVARLTVVRWESGERKIKNSLIDDVVKETGIPAKELRPDLAKILDGGVQ